MTKRVYTDGGLERIVRFPSLFDTQTSWSRSTRKVKTSHHGNSKGLRTIIFTPPAAGITTPFSLTISIIFDSRSNAAGGASASSVFFSFSFSVKTIQLPC